MERQGDLVHEGGDLGRRVCGLAERDGPLWLVVIRIPGHRPTIQLVDELWLAPFELEAQQLPEKMVVAVLLASIVQRHDEAVRAFQCVEHLRGALGFQDGVA